MYFELYLDILFLINFMMDSMVLLIVKGFTKYESSYIRIFIASGVGAIGTCLLMVQPTFPLLSKIGLLHVALTTIMIWISFGISEIKRFCVCYISLYIGSFLLGGVFTYFKTYLQISSLYFFIAFVCYIVVNCMVKFIGYMKHEEKWYVVKLIWQNHSISVNALLDTGNGLRDPYMGKPVCIVDRACLSRGFPKIETQSLIYIPYHTIDGSGILEGYIIDKMYIGDKTEKCVEKPLIAVSKNGVSVNQKYQMILNPDIL